MTSHDFANDSSAAQWDAAARPSKQVAARHAPKEMLRFVTCGGAGDGKSTLIGSLLRELGALPDDQERAPQADLLRAATQGGDLDFAVFTGGLAAKSDQAISMGVAYRQFATAKRRFIVADTPGHEQGTGNIVAGASTADLAVVLVDASKGLLPLTRLHSYLVSLLGIRHVVLAVNKMDLVGYEKTPFEQLVLAYQELARSLGLASLHAVPVAAVSGDNLVLRSTRMPWYAGPTLLEQLETADLGSLQLQAQPFRMPVQSVNPNGADPRCLAGTAVSGQVRLGEAVRIMPAGLESTVARIVTPGGDLQMAASGALLTLVLAQDIEVAPGDVVCAADAPAESASQFQATVVWMDSQPLLRGRSYRMRVGSAIATATVMPIRHRIDIQTLAPVAAERLELNEIGEVELELDRTVAFDPYRVNRNMGGFILIDRISNRTVGAGMLHFGLRRGDNLRWQDLDVDKAARQRLNGHGSAVVWLTGLSGAGKSNIANTLEKRLHTMGVRTYVLDGDNVRHGLNKDLGFTAQDRVENIRRVAEVARLMVDAGTVVIAALISPFRAERQMARDLFAPGEFIEVFVDTPLPLAEQRDPKGLYAKARRGELKNFTGIDSPYEVPSAPELVLDTEHLTAQEAVDILLQRLVRMQIVTT